MLREISHTVSGKLFLGFWGLSVCVVVAASVIGLLDGEIAGGVAASVLIAGMLTIVSIIISFWAGANLTTHTILVNLKPLQRTHQ